VLVNGVTAALTLCSDQRMVDNNETLYNMDIACVSLFSLRTHLASSTAYLSRMTSRLVTYLHIARRVGTRAARYHIWHRDINDVCARRASL